MEACSRTDSGKCWRRRLRATIEDARAPGLLLCLLAAASAFAQPGGDGRVARERAESLLEAFNADVHSLTAAFTQETWSVDNRIVDEAGGIFALRRPGRFVWHTQRPYEHLVIADGETIWMYDVEVEQATRTAFSDLPAANPGLLLSGDRPVREDYDIVGTYDLDGREFVELRPKDPRAEYSRVLVAFRDAAPVAIEIVDGLNQTTRIEFSDVEINPDIAPSRFEFEPPRGVDVIGGDR